MERLVSCFNINNSDTLDKQLLPGLSVLGVPKGLKYQHTFFYNSIDSFKELISKHKDIGVICIEGARNELPTKAFLERDFSVCRKNNTC